jgi:hypothetical protein
MAALHQESIAGHGLISIADHHNRPDFLAAKGAGAGPSPSVYHLPA